MRHNGVRMFPTSWSPLLLLPRGGRGCGAGLPWRSIPSPRTPASPVPCPPGQPCPPVQPRSGAASAASNVARGAGTRRAPGPAPGPRPGLRAECTERPAGWAVPGLPASAAIQRLRHAPLAGRHAYTPSGVEGTWAACPRRRRRPCHFGTGPVSAQHSSTSWRSPVGFYEGRSIFNKTGHEDVQCGDVWGAASTFAPLHSLATFSVIAGV